MPNRELLPALVLAIVMLTGCKQPVGLPSSDVHSASIRTTNCYIDTFENRSGHVDWYQGELPIYDDDDIDFGTITRAYDCYPGDPDRAYPRKNGYCVFSVPDFESPGMVPVCTLVYYQTGHSGSADLLANWVTPEFGWPDPLNDIEDFYWAISSSTDTAGTDVTHANDNTWYKVPLTLAAGAAIHYAAGGFFIMGWVYPDSADGTYTDVAGVGAYAPYIKVVYDDEP
jgi:hypothetical protein